MFKKIVKKIAMGTLALTCAFGCIGTFTACEESNPKARIVLEFNGEEYVLDYVLHKDKTPATVKHFIWLVENDWYDGLCIHDYQSGKMYTGAYSFDENGNLDYKDYYEFVETSKDFKDFPQTVWENHGKDDEGDYHLDNPLYSVYGEFSDNSFNVGKNNQDAVKQQYGSLSMFYHAKEDTGKVLVKNSKGKLIERDYSENSATSMFYISTTTSSTTNNSHCTFATLTKKDKDVLEDLEEAIADYIGEEEDSWFVTPVKMTMYDRIVGTKELKNPYQVPNKPIIVKSARITKY